MAIKTGNTGITGTDRGLTAYFSGGHNIIRAASSLTGARVKKDPAFAGFRQSGNRMKEAAPMAAVLYNQIPKDQKQFSLYRLLTGEALKMIKLGLDKTGTTEKLQKQYINPVLQERITSRVYEESKSCCRQPALPVKKQNKTGKGYIQLTVNCSRLLN